MLRNVLITTGLGCGRFWSALDLLGSTSAPAVGTWSDSDDLLKRDDYWRSSSGGAIAAGRFLEFGSGGHPMTVSAQLRFFRSGTPGVHDDFSR